jgi:hypothetical protein
MAKKRSTKKAPAVQHIVHVSTGVGTYCEHCGEPVGCFEGKDPGLAKSVNHYIEQHGYTLLHVGTETSRDDQGKPWHATVAVLGK